MLRCRGSSRADSAHMKSSQSSLYIQSECVIYTAKRTFHIPVLLIGNMFFVICHTAFCLFEASILRSRPFSRDALDRVVCKSGNENVMRRMHAHWRAVFCSGGCGGSAVVLDFEFNQVLYGNVLHTHTRYDSYRTRLLESPASFSTITRSYESPCITAMLMRVRGMILLV